MTALKVEGLSFGYDEEPFILKNMSFSIEEGQTIGIIGLSGCGKTTLCHCLCGIIPNIMDGQMDGDIKVFDKSTKENTLANLSGQVGIVFQDPDNQIVTTTLEDEIAFAPENICIEQKKIEKIVEESLELLGFERLRLKNPDKLSMGQKKLLEIGAVMSLRPKILIMDEPFSGLDEDSVELVRSMLFQLKKNNTTLILVDHDFEQIKFADRWLVIEDGCLIRDDAPEIIMADEEFLDLKNLVSI